MGAVKKLIDKKVLRTLVPINALSAIHIEEISKKAIIEEVRSGAYVFKRGDRDYQTVFVLEGKVELVDNKHEVIATVIGGSDAARHPLAHKQPRHQSARAAGKVTVARIDSSLLDVLLTWDESSGYDVQEIGAQEDDDWMTRMLQSQAFLQLPPSNIHQLLMRLEAVSVNAGDVVVRQGEDGDYFYIVKSGRLAVTRKASVRSKEVLLAELGEGACFGEEALVSGTKRNASVTMITDGSLMRLSKTDFNELLCASLVHEADYEGAKKLVAKGAQWLDVRLPGEFENQAIKDSINVPLSALRDHCQELDAGTDYIICCDTGRRSAAGAFLLSQRGLNVYTLKNGLMDVPDDALTHQNTPKKPASTKDADIIPFESEVRPDNQPDTREAVDSDKGEQVDALLIDKLAASEADKLALEKQLEEVAVQRDSARQELGELISGQREYKADLEKFQGDVEALQKQLSEVETRSAEDAEEKQTLQGLLEERDATIAAEKQKRTSVETEKQYLQAELTGIQQTLAQIQSSSEGRDDALRKELERMSASLAKERKNHARKSSELQDELDKIRDDYAQLGQRTSQVAGERDAAVVSLEELRNELSEARKQLDAAGEEVRGLKQQLVDANEQASAERSNTGELQDQLGKAKQAAEEQLEQMSAELGKETDGLKQRIFTLEEQLEEAHNSAGTDQEALSKQLDSAQQELEAEKSAHSEQAEQREQLERQLAELQQRLEEARNSAGTDQEALSKQLDSVQQELEAEKSAHSEQAEQREQLEQQLGELRQQLDVAVQDARQQLDQIHAEAVAEKKELGKQLESLQQEVDSRQQRSDEFEQGRALLEEQLADLQQQLKDKDELLQQHENDKSDNELLREKLDETEAQVESLKAGLEGERTGNADATRRLEELDQQLARKDKDHELDIASTREALSRAQVETDNIKREQTRLMEMNRKLERDLERERHDHESEVHRLRKELKSVAGETGAGLEAELDALQERIKQDARARDDLEIKLGERSAQVEDSKADIEKLQAQLTQAQDSARQAEQQLLETTQQANEEMAVRMEAEEKAQTALRDELASVISERNQTQEQLTVQMQELDELRAGLASANESLARSEGVAGSLEEEIARLSEQRDAALEKQEQVQQDLDQLRAEAEVTRGLVDMQLPAGEVDSALREELEQAKKNVDVAVRLRGQAEEKVVRLESELDELRYRLSEIESEAAELPPGHIPSLDDNDPSAAALLAPEYPDDDGINNPAPQVLLEEDNTIEDSVGSVAASSQTGGRKGLIGGVLAALVAVAGAGYWWMQNQSLNFAGIKMPGSGLISFVTATDSEKNNEKSSGAKPQNDSGTDVSEFSAPPDAETAADIGQTAAAVIAPGVGKPAESHESDKLIVADAPAEETAESKIQEPRPRVIPNFAKGGDDLIIDAESRGGDDVTGSNEAPDSRVKDASTNKPEVTESEPVKVKPQPVRTYSQPLSVGGRGPVMVEFQADSFSMGSSSASANFDERPQHTVELRSFSISKREVTFDEYSLFAGATGRRQPTDEGWGRGQRPVINVSWHDASAYAEWLSEQTGSHYRLPTEAEWEFAASAGSDARFWWGNDVGSRNANCFDCGSKWSGIKTAPVGSFSASAYGVQDMLGNVMEWVQDCYRKSYNSAPLDGSAVIVAGDCKQRVVRGGGFDSPADSLRSASRDSRVGNSRLNNLGFRVVKAAH